VPTIPSFACTILDWHDADTCRVLVDLGLAGLTMHRVLRVFGINAPELNCDAGLKAKATAESLAPQGSVVVCRTAKRRECEKYGRWLATIELAGGLDFAAEMIRQGAARAYFGEDECIE